MIIMNVLAKFGFTAMKIVAYKGFCKK